MRRPVRVLVADDHRIVREGIVRILHDAPNVDVVGEAADGYSTVELAVRLRPDIVIMDLTMPRLNGRDAVRRISEVLPDVRVLVLTVHEDEEYIVPLVKAGAAGYLVKDSASSELVAAIECLARGETWFGPQAARVLVEQFQRPSKVVADPYGSLTNREREVFHLVIEGRTGREMAAIMGIAPKTANNHRSNMMSKLGLHNTADLVRYAARKGLLPDEHPMSGLTGADH